MSGREVFFFFFSPFSERGSPLLNKIFQSTLDIKDTRV